MKTSLRLPRGVLVLILFSVVLATSARAQSPTVSLLMGPRQVAGAGQSFTFGVSATGAAPLTYQWRRNGLPVVGATGASFTIGSVAARDNGYYQAVVTNGAGAVTSAPVFLSVIYSAGQLVAWGANDYGQTTIPTGLTGVVAVAAGCVHTVALKSDGSVVAWGYNSYGQTAVPAGLTGVVAVAAGGFHTLALKSDGTVVAWGDSSYAQTTLPAGLSGVVAIAAGRYHSLALKSDGTIVAWGSSNSGETTVPSGLSGVVAVAAGDSASLALKFDGTVVAWGSTSWGQTNVPTGLSGVIAIATNYEHCLALKSDGTVVAWGYSYDTRTTVPVGLSSVVAVAAGYSHSLALKSDGTVIAWGASQSGQTVVPSLLGGVVAVAAGNSYNVVLRDASNDRAPTITASPTSVAANLGQSVTLTVNATAGTAGMNYQWFDNGTAITGATSSSYVVGEVTAASAGSYYATVSNLLGTATSGTAVLTVNTAPVVSATTGGRYVLNPGQNLTLTLASSIGSSATVQWRRNGRVITGATGRSYTITNATLPQAGYYQAVYNEGAGAAMSVAIFISVVPAATQVLAWGGDTGSVPMGLSNIVMVAAGSGSTLALKADGTVVNWSAYSYSSYPPPAGTGNVVAIAACDNNYLALRGDGTVVAWGDSYSGVTPVPTGLSGVVAIAAGSSHGLALKSDGTVVAWGHGDYGATAVPVGLTDIVGVAAGNGFSLALRADGTAVGWGSNGYGQSSVPSGLSGVIAIAAGDSFSLALKSDGTVVAWGYNGSGQTTVPAGLSGVIAITAGDAHSLALKADGTVIGWGYNSNGQTNVPAGLKQVFSLAAGNYNSVAVRDASGDTAPAISTQPASVTAFKDQNVTLTVSANGGTAALTYQWRKGGTAIAGATGASLTLQQVSTADAGSYDVVVADQLGLVTSAAAALAVNATPAVTTNITGRQVLAAAQSLTLSASAAIPGPVTYQWRRNGLAIVGATNAAYTIGNATGLSGGVYQVVVSNSVGPAVSAPVFVGVSGNWQLRAWGDNSYGQTTVPTDLTGVIAVAAGYYHSLALKSDGTVVAWGVSVPSSSYNSYNYGQTNVPAELANVVAIAAGDYFSMALRGDGTVVTWGSVNYTPSGLTDVVAIAAGGGNAAALLRNGSIVTWTSSSVGTGLPAGQGGTLAIAQGNSAWLALQSDRTVASWSNGTPPSAQTVPVGLTGVVAVSAGYDHYLALKSDGTVVAWGYNSNGDTTVPAGLANVVAVEAGNYTSFALKADGSVVAWGNYTYYTSSGYVSLTAAASSLAPVFALSAGPIHGLALRDPSGDVAPTLAAQLANQTAVAGDTVTFTVQAVGTPPPTYQWSKDGTAISGATTATLTLTSVFSSSVGSYTVTITNLLGSVTSNAATLAVNPNLNQRGLLTGTAHAYAGSGATVLNGTFTIEGSTAKQMLVRAVGPGLLRYGVTDVLVDPQLTITAAATGNVFATNDDWANTYSVSTATSQVGAFPLTAGSKDAVVCTTFPPGTYQARVTGANNGTGVALLEVYDADSSPRLVYLATRALAGSGGKAFIQGFAVSGAPAGRSYLIRALGPALGAPGALADPQLAVFNASGGQVAANDNWGGDPTLANLAAGVGAMPLAGTSQDAAVNFVPAAAGAYTVQVSGVGGTTGLALVEIFEVDAQRASTVPVTVVAPPADVTTLVGQPASFSVVATGKPAPTYQWRKNGTPIAGATNAGYSIAAASSADIGDYSIALTNGSGTVVSSPARLTVATQTGTHAVVGSGYLAGVTVTITNTLSYSSPAGGLGWSATIPPGWSYAGGGVGEGDVKPAVGATGTLDWAWTTPPPSPVTFTYTLNVPPGETGTRTVAANAIARLGGEPQTVAVSPNPLLIDAAPLVHTADTDQDGRISLLELTRVIELFNTRNGTTRTGCYAVQTGSEDGFAPDPTRPGGTTVTLPRYHSADTDRNGKLSLLELTRVIELYNYRVGTSRTGQYHVQAGTEDGFAPGP
jgi:alpha-tubulin suppressor-like RCC1 family protein